MSSDYPGVVWPRLFTGTTGRTLFRRGGQAAQRLSVYLCANDHMNMIGFYPLTLIDVEQELQLSRDGALKAFALMADEGFAFYDAYHACVWVREMARVRMWLHPGQQLADGDKRAKAADRLYAQVPINTLLGLFFDRYAVALRLSTRREAAIAPIAAATVAEKLLVPVDKLCAEGASMPLARTLGDRTRSRPSTRTRQSAADGAVVSGPDDERRRQLALRIVVNATIDTVGVDAPVDELAAAVAARCQDGHLEVDPAAIPQQLNLALFARRRPPILAHDTRSRGSSCPHVTPCPSTLDCLHLQLRAARVEGLRR